MLVQGKRSAVNEWHRMIRQQSDDWEISFQISWRQLLAILLTLAGMLVLGFGVVRPMLSAQLGREVSRQLNEELAREVVVILTSEFAAPVASEGVANAPVANGAGASAAGGAQPAAGGAAAATDAPGPVDSAGLLRAIAEQPAAGSASTSDQLTVVSGSADAPVTAGTERAPAVPGAASENGAPAAPGVVNETPGGNAAPGAGAAAGSTPAQEQPAAVAPREVPVLEAPVDTGANAPPSAEEIVAALPSGTLTISEERLNTRISERAAALGPIESLSVRFLADEIQVRLIVLGQETLGSAGLSVAEGRIVAQNPELSGALSLFLSVDDFVQPIETELNAILVGAERNVTGVQITEGAITVTLE